MKSEIRIIRLFAGMWLCLGLGVVSLFAQGGTGIYNTIIVSNDFRQMSSPYTNYFAGSLGVGTNVAAEKLHVNGNIRVDGYIAENLSLSAVVLTHVNSLPAAKLPTAGTIIGCGAYNGATNGNFSVAIGYGAVQSANVGASAVFLGPSAGASSSNLASSTVIGYYAGRNASNCQSSVIQGPSAGYSAKECSYGVFVGYHAGHSGMTNNYATFVGAAAGKNATNCAYDVFLGYAAGYGNPPVTNSVALGYYAIVAADSTVVLGKGCDVVVGGTQASDAKVLLSREGSASFAGSGSFSNGVTYAKNLGDISMGVYTNGP
jgi:hypothetical protein